MFSSQTVIVIEISSNRVVETLDILIHSLVDPLMLPKTIYDQIQIIDDESSIAQFDDHYRATRLLAHLARENHPIAKFSWGENSHQLFI
jgi:secreted Zn-dependent insulinase-like peptidase